MPAILVGAATPPPAHTNNTVGLKKVGPIDETNGFPLWYKDTNGHGSSCASTTPTASWATCRPWAAAVFPDNFPDEAFWAMAEAALATNGTGGKASGHALEAAFAADVADGQQISFGRSASAPRWHRRRDLQGHPPFWGRHDRRRDRLRKGINVTEDIGDLAGGSDLRPERSAAGPPHS